MPGRRDKGLIFIVCPNCNRIIDYQFIGPNGAGGRYSGPPSMWNIIEKNHVCPHCKSSLRIPSSSELLASIEIMDIETFRGKYSVYVEKDTGIPRFLKPRGLPASSEHVGLSETSFQPTAEESSS
ncbi:MAG: hypothetical protein F7C32_02925 [Desulfurococcales archaeon]|nr:hypothetical protein [Desulfurococcales archaeon]